MALSHYMTDEGHDPYNDVQTGNDMQSGNRHVLAGQWCVGATLRSAREAGGESLEDVAQAVRIRPEYLFAIEEENYYGLPGWAYAVGYVRSYAMYLGLDSGPMVKRVRDQLALREHVFEQREIERSVSFSRLLSIGGVAVLVCALGIGLWFTGPAQSVTEFFRPVPGQILSFFDRPAPAPTQISSKSDATPPEQLGVETKFASLNPMNSQSMTPVQPLLSQGVSVPEPGFFVLKPLPRHSIDRGAINYGELTLRARDDVWFRVEDTTGSIIAERQMGRGEVQKLSHVRDLVIAARDGGAIEYYLDGTFGGVLGQKGQALRDLSLATFAVRKSGG